uniref:Uncharacterized protein n=1 Tax=Arundo donax TaxID=35708 RepID=A0A0A9HQM1_ARUDO
MNLTFYFVSLQRKLTGTPQIFHSVPLDLHWSWADLPGRMCDR